MGRRWFRVRKAGSNDAEAERRPWKRFKLFTWRLKGLKFSASVLDNISFRILYVVEAVVLVAGLCLFFFCCGCHI